MDSTLPAAAETAAHVHEAVGHLSFIDFFLMADPVVKSVMAILVVGSVAVWAIVAEKMARGRRLRRAVAEFGDALSQGRGADPNQSIFARTVLTAAARELQMEPAGESLGERRARVERAARRAGYEALRPLETGLPFLATVSSAGPFIGLFGTVWGIMNSFSAIAASQDTSLAVVAPGIAEALFATALGLIAAVPAVIAYNRYATSLRRLQSEVAAAVERLGAELVHRRAVTPRAAA